MKQFLTILVVVFGLSACATNQPVRQLPRSVPEPVLVQTPSASVVPGADKTAEPDPKSNIVVNTALEPEGCATVEVDYDLEPTAMAGCATVAIDYYLGPTVIVKRCNLTSKDPQPKSRAVGTTTKEICWFKFDHATSSEDARKKVEASGEFLVGDLWELYALGEVRTDLQRGFPSGLLIVALGSRWRRSFGFVYYPTLRKSRYVHILDLHWDKHGYSIWRDFVRFLAVRIRK